MYFRGDARRLQLHPFVFGFLPWDGACLKRQVRGAGEGRSAAPRKAFQVFCSFQPGGGGGSGGGGGGGGRRRRRRSSRMKIIVEIVVIIVVAEVVLVLVLVSSTSTFFEHAPCPLLLPLIQRRTSSLVQRRTHPLFNPPSPPSFSSGGGNPPFKEVTRLEQVSLPFKETLTPFNK